MYIFLSVCLYGFKYIHVVVYHHHLPSPELVRQSEGFLKHELLLYVTLLKWLIIHSKSQCPSRPCNICPSRSLPTQLHTDVLYYSSGSLGLSFPLPRKFFPPKLQGLLILTKCYFQRGHPWSLIQKGVLLHFSAPSPSIMPNVYRFICWPTPER